MCCGMSRQRRASQRGRAQLTLVPGDEYLESVEPQSLQVLVRSIKCTVLNCVWLVLQTYCKLARLPVEVHTACLPWKSPSWKYPVMKLGNKTVSRSVEDIIAAVKQAVRAAVLVPATCTLPSLPWQGFNLDRSLGDAAVTETAAYSALLTHRLLPAMV
jgi:hypothetical protein